MLGRVDGVTEGILVGMKEGRHVETLVRGSFVGAWVGKTKCPIEIKLLYELIPECEYK